MSNLIINANSIYDRVIRIGRQTENLVSSITFNLNMWIEEYGAGECVLNVRRNGDGSAYPVLMTIADGMATWTITDTDTAKKGRGEVQLVYRAGDKVKTSPIFTISCGESLVGGEVPEPYEEWLTELNRMTAQVEAAKTSASASAQTAQTAANTATEKATEAAQSAEFAYNHYESARQSAVSAQASKTGAIQAAANAHESATEAAQSATMASVESTAAESAKQAAQTAESNAQGFAQTASAKASEAAESVTDAQAEADRAKSEADRAKTYADRAAEVELEIPTKVSELENDAGYLTEHQSLDDYVRKDVLYNMLPADSASGPIVSFPDGADDIPLKSLVVGIEPVQSGEGDPSQENIRPISGWTGMALNVNGAEIPISWESEAGTVYGGTLDVLSGVLTVDRAMVDLGTLSWTKYTANTNIPVFYTKEDAPNMKPGAGSSAKCSIYRCTSWTSLQIRIDKTVEIHPTIGRPYIADSTYTDAKTFKSAMSGVQLCYKLATPITYQLTPHEVKSMLGSNTIYADTGNTAVEYRADIQRYIEKKLSTQSTVSLTRSMPVQIEETEPTISE